MKKLFLMVFIVVGLIAFALPAEATVISWGFNHEFSGATPPEGASPWLTATFDDQDTAGIVYLTMTATNLTDNEFVDDWYFNIDPGFTVTPSDPTITEWTRSGTFSFSDSTDVDTGSNAFKADGGGRYDIKFVFANAPPVDRFGVGDSLTVKIVGTGLLAGSFNFESTPDGGNGTWLSAAHIGGIGPGDELSGWVAPSNGPPVPEPATMLLLGSGLIGLAGLGRKKFFKRG